MGIFSSMINAQMQRDTNETNLQIARETNEANLNLAREQNQWNIDQWNRENAYNDPAAQAQRLRDAGLSAAAAAQQVNGGQASHLESANLANQQSVKIDSPRMDFNLAQDALNVASAFGGAANAMKAFDEAKLWEDTLLTNLDAQRWATELTIQQYLKNQLQFPHEIRESEYKANSAYWRWRADENLPRNMEIGNQIAEANRNLLQKQVDAFDRNNQVNYDKAIAELNNLRKQGDNLTKQGKLIDANTSLTYAETEKTNAETENVGLQGELIKANTDVARQDNRIKEVIAILKEAGEPEHFQERIAALMEAGKMDEEDLQRFLESLRDGTSVADVCTKGDFNMELYYYEVFGRNTGDLIKAAPKTIIGGIGSIIKK